MTYCPDLGPCFGDKEPRWPHRLAVGWLDDLHAFPTDPVAPELIERIVALCGHPVDHTLGFHRCELCDDGFSNGVVRVAGPAALYVAPQMLAHYVTVHSYQPPAPFLDALLHGPSAPLPHGEPRRWLHLSPQQIADHLRSPAVLEDSRWPHRDTDLPLIEVLEHRKFGARWCAELIELLRDPAYCSSPELLVPDEITLTEEYRAWRAFLHAADRARAAASVLPRSLW